jgi:hypothetical protein
MTLQIGDILTRDQLSHFVGAGGDSCFLHKQKAVVAIAMNPVLNPDAPEILLVGRGPMKERYAATLLASDDFVPTFVKCGVNQWEYVGEFKAEKIKRDKDLISEHSKRSGRYDIWGVLYLLPLTS